jgi:hypothetical protein
MAGSAENTVNLTVWYLVCQKSSGILSVKNVSCMEETSRARTQTNQGAATYG